MKSSKNVLSLIKHYEGLKLKAYLCPAGVPTIGMGSTRVDGDPVKLGQICTEAQAEEYVLDELGSIEITLTKLIKVNLNQGQFDAIVDFCFNLGTGNFGSSTLLKLINQGKFVDAAKEFRKWTKATDPKTGQKVELAGLLKRRSAEEYLFINGSLPTQLP